MSHSTTERYYGTWQAVEATLGGQTMDQEIVDATTLKIAGESYQVVLAGTPDAGRCEWDTHAIPFRIKIQGTEGPNAGKTYLAILELVDDSQLQIAYDLSGAGYPETFQPLSVPTSYVAKFVRVP